MATQNNITVRDGAGQPLTRRAYDIDGARADGPFVPEIGEKADTAWAGTGDGGVIAVLKAVFGRLGGVVLAAGTAVVGKVGLQVGGADVAGGNPLPSQLVAGTAVVGKVGLQVGGADLAVSNPLIVSPANKASGVTPVTATLAVANASSGWFSLVPGRTFYTWLTAGSWTGSLFLELSYDGGTTVVPITYGTSQLMVFTRLGVTPFTVHEAGVTARLTTGSNFSGTVTGRISA